MSSFEEEIGKAAATPVWWSETLRRWIVTGYEEARAVLREVGAFSSAVIPQLPPSERALLETFATLSERWLFFLDPPEHYPVRTPVTRFFSPRALEPLTPRITAIAEELLNRVEAQGEMDLIADYAFPLAARIMAGFLCETPEETDRFLALSLIVGAVRANPRDSATRRRGFDAIAALTEYIRYIAAQDKASLPPFMTHLFAAGLEEENVAAQSLVLVFAGIETTQNLIGNGVYTLLRHPDQWALLGESAGRFEVAIEECLRYAPPVRGVIRRVAEPVELGGQRLGVGNELVVLLSAVNRDPDRFPDPDRFDIRRQNGPALSFGQGAHFCPGSTLARRTARIALELLYHRYPNLCLTTDTAAWYQHDPMVRGLITLPTRF